MALGLWFAITLQAAFTLAINPRFFLRSRQALVITTGIVGMGTLFGGYGLFNLVFTFLNAFALRGLDGEWGIELGPILDAVGILYLTACLLLFRCWWGRPATKP